MKSFIFLAIAGIVFFAIVVGDRLIKEDAFAWGPSSSSSGDSGDYGLDADALALCLSSRGALLFGADWCPACRHQDELFGSAASYLEHIDCDENPSACADAGVRSIPAWEIEGRLHSGVQSLDKLAQMSGCREQAVAQGGQTGLPALPEMRDWEVSEISYSWRDANGGFHVTTEAPPKGAIDVEVFR